MLRPTLLRLKAPASRCLFQLPLTIRTLSTAAAAANTSKQQQQPPPPPPNKNSANYTARRPARKRTTTLASQKTPNRSPFTPSSATNPAKPLPPAPYLVSRTPSNNLPVYQLAKRGGNYKLTAIKKIDGDARTMQKWLADELGMDLDQVRVKTPTGHIEVVGHHKQQITEWLERHGF
ncbi:mitochondrial large subunit ribosomal protein-domain-containing protein [Podospora appendiculata]|uniref:Large ribosomal subunit protein mL49 n=1 Tax=Podospora appendiculata TaxID=314037 RepID=A0AAE0XAA1_9PEZI|nr:mitochondrial large subunit ribosomal protein-domain-containing protein [Podospora appendiculata]